MKSYKGVYSTARGVLLVNGKIVGTCEDVTLQMRPKAPSINADLTNDEKKSGLVISLENFLKNRGKNEKKSL